MSADRPPPPSGDEPQPGAAASPPPQQRRRRRGRRLGRFLLWSAVTLIVLLVLAVVTIELVLQTDMPRRMVIDQIERELGLVVEGRSMTIGWTGRTTLRDVTLSLPLADQAFLEVPVLHVQHTNLPWLILTRDMDIHALALERPSLLVQQDEDGRWNLLEVADLLGRTAGAEPAAAAGPQRGPLLLPRVRIDEASVHIRDNQGREAVVAPLYVAGRPEALRWDFRVQVRGPQERMRIDADGRIVPGQFWQHQVEFRIRDIEPFLADWLALGELDVAGEWWGRAAADGLDGQLRLKESLVGPALAAGVIRVQRNEDGIIIRPDGFVIERADGESPVGSGPSAELNPAHRPLSTADLWSPGTNSPQSALRLELTSGRIIIDDELITLDELSMKTMEGVAVAAGWYHPARESGQIELRWKDIVPAADVQLEGGLTAALSLPWPNRPQIDITFSTDAQTNFGFFEAAVHVAGRGRTWRDITFNTEVERLAWTREAETISIRDLEAEFHLLEDRLELLRVSHPGEGRLRGAGAIERRRDEEQPDLLWWLWLQADDWVLRDLPDLPLNAVLNVWGNREQAELKQLYLRAAALEMELLGDWVFLRPEPVDVWLHVAHMPPETGLPEPEHDPFISGDLHALLNLTGTLTPLDLDVHGELFARDLVVQRHLIPNVEMLVEGTIDAERAILRSERFEMLGGHLEFFAQYPHEDEDLPAMAELRFEGINMAVIGHELLERDDMHGVVDGRLIVLARQFQLDRIRADGSIEGRDLVIERFRADTLSASLDLRHGWLELAPIELAVGDAAAEARIALDLNARHELVFQADVRGWPFEIPETGGLAWIWSEADLWIDSQRMAAVGQFILRTDFQRGEDSLGTASVEIQANDREFIIEPLRGEAFGGEFDGRATIDLEDPLDSRLLLRFNDIQMEEVKVIFPAAEDVYGTFSGRIGLEAETQPRSLGPVRLHVQVLTHNGAYRTITIGNTDLSFVLSRDRIILERSPIQLAGGTIHLRARATRRDPDVLWHRLDEIWTQFEIDHFENLELNQFVQAGDEGRDPLHGRLGGNLTLGGPLIGPFSDEEPIDPARLFGRLFGEGQVQIARSDLANFPPLALLYSLARVDLRTAQFTGTGSAGLRLDDGKLEIDAIEYFNRGLEISADLTIENIWHLSQSPIRGTALGTARPLAEIRLPLIRDLDQIITVLQRDFTGVEIDGTLGDPQGRPVPFDQLTEPLRRLLGG